jgi:polar amino acid transport system substrate-binding protein
VGAGPVQQRDPAGHEGVRHVPHAGLLQPRARRGVDLSEGYFDLNQSVVTLEDNPIAKVTDVASLKAFKLGSQVGTTSFRYITDTIQPTAAPMAYDSMDAGDLRAQGEADRRHRGRPSHGVLHARRAAQRERRRDRGVPADGRRAEHFSILLGKDSPLTDCVNQALASMKADGSLQAIVDEWITGQGAPVLE